MKRKAEGGIVKGQLGSEIREARLILVLYARGYWATPGVNLHLRLIVRTGSSVAGAMDPDCFGQFLNCAVDRKSWSEIRFLAFLLCRAIHFQTLQLRIIVSGSKRTQPKVQAIRAKVGPRQFRIHVPVRPHQRSTIDIAAHLFTPG